MLLLAKNGVDISNVSHNGLNALHIAVTHNYAEVVNLLITYDFPINERTNSGMTALLISVYKKHHRCIEALLNSKQADIEIPNKAGMTPLQLALKLEDQISIKLLIEEGATVFYTKHQLQELSPLLYVIRK